jgi:hypothetical protein
MQLGPAIQYGGSPLPELEPKALPPVSWSSIVERIRTGDSAACEELYSAAFTDVRRWFSQRLGVQYAHDRTHDTYLATIRDIINEDPRLMRIPARLMGIPASPTAFPASSTSSPISTSALLSGAFAKAGSARSRQIIWLCSIPLAISTAPLSPAKNATG